MREVWKLIHLIAASGHFHRSWLVRARQAWQINSLHKQIIKQNCYLLCWLANLRKVPPLRNLTIKLVCLPLLFHPFNLRCCLLIYPQYWRGPPGQKLMWFQSQKKRRTPVLSSVQAPWSSIKRERTHAAHGCRFKGIYLQTTAATLMTEQEGSQLAS